TEPAGMFNYIASWGGMHGGVELEATARTWIEEVHVTTQVQWKIVKFKIGVQSRETGNTFEANLGVVLSSGREQRTHEQTVDFRVQPGRMTSVEVEVPMPEAIPEASLWSPETPSLYTARLVLRCGTRECDRVEQ